MTQRPTDTRAPKIADYMARQLVTLTPEMDITKAIRLLLNQRFSGAPVIDADGRLVGVLSTKDCLKVAFTSSYHQEWGGSVADYMTAEVETLDADTDVIAAAKRFLAGPYRRFPVLRDGRLAGQISRNDILRALCDLW
jgi:CBS domain-containing protein